MKPLLSFLSVAMFVSVAAAGEPGAWVDLLADNGKAWKTIEPGWIKTDTVIVDPMKKNLLKASAKDGGTVWVNGEKGKLKDLYTKQKFGDCEVQIEFLLATKSNSGIKFHGVYEIQIHDSFGIAKDKLKGEHSGGIYPRAVYQPNYKHIDDGIAPTVNACKKPGEWQTLTVIFHAAKFNDKNEKTANAKIVKATLNDQVVQDHVEMKTPTGNNWEKKEVAVESFMLQADHGPIAIRSFKIRDVK
jgi:hypothetical protein